MAKWMFTLGLAIMTTALTSAGPWVAANVAPDQRDYYVDSQAGDDALTGTSRDQAWRTLERASSAPLHSGDRVLLRSGRNWTGNLELHADGIAASPIVVEAYGDGPRPRLTGGRWVILAGSYTIVRGVHVDRCTWAGITMSGHHNAVEATLITGNVAGINVQATARDNRIRGNVIRDNNRMSVATASPGDDSGAWGVLLRGDRTEVRANTISGSDAASPDYGRDGAAVEVYGGRNNHVHHNIAVENNIFSELGNDRSAGNVFAYNVVWSTLPRAGFLTTRGSESRYGPVAHTTVLNNTVFLTGSDSQGLVCHGGCGPDVLRARNNVIQAGKKAAYADAPFDEDYGIYWGGRVELLLGPHSQVADPRFVDAARGDLRPSPDGPGVDTGITTGYRRDAAGAPVPTDGNGDGFRATDSGAYERSVTGAGHWGLTLRIPWPWPTVDAALAALLHPRRP